MRYAVQFEMKSHLHFSSPLVPYSNRNVNQKAKGVEVIEDHDMLEMVSGPSIEPSYIKLVRSRVATGTCSVDDYWDTWIKQAQT